MLPTNTVISSGAACRYGADGKCSHDTLSREISHRNAARTIRGGDFPTLWRLCIESPSQPKLASSLQNKRLSYWRLTGFGRNDGGGGQCFYNLRPLKGKRLTTFCASLALLQNVFAVHRRAPPQSFEPSEPYEPSEPSRPQGVSIGEAATTTLGPKARQT